MEKVWKTSSSPQETGSWVSAPTGPNARGTRHSETRQGESWIRARDADHVEVPVLVVTSAEARPRGGA